MKAGADPVYVGISLGPEDPSAAVVRAGKVLAYAEEERFVRSKHAIGVYPLRSLVYCLEQAATSVDDVSSVSVSWDLSAYSDGTMARFYEGLSEEWDLDEATRAWQQQTLAEYDYATLTARHRRRWTQEFGLRRLPPIRFAAHHYTHAFQAATESPFESAVVLTADGSGEDKTTVLWVKRGTDIRPLRTVRIPHSLGWYYAAFTEYLGFQAYDGEYKVMGLAAHGEPVESLRDAVRQILTPAPDGVEYRIDPTLHPLRGAQLLRKVHRQAGETAGR
ncbi:putative NodU family carbamoyl transferase [Catenulispora sp. MAP12-49]|uniref:carbamoyltransferase N-terminal domain-containing protein n=1 Tax=unclassified Catenulispora TaxID=414885 RepID=UPI0035178FEF